MIQFMRHINNKVNMLGQYEDFYIVITSLFPLNEGKDSSMNLFEEGVDDAIPDGPNLVPMM